MKKIRFRLLVVVLTINFLLSAISGTVSAEENVIYMGQNPFLDISETDPFYDAVLYCYNAGIIKGVSDTLFAPDIELTRAMFVTLLGRIAENMELKTDGYTSSFIDVVESSWYDTYVGWAAVKGFVNGMSIETFEPNTILTREQALTILIRFCDKTGLELKNDIIEDYADFSTVSSWAQSAMEKAVSSGLAPVSDDGLLNPQQNVTRAEAAEMLYRLCTYYIGNLKLIEIFGRYIKVFENLPTNPYSKECFGIGENGYKNYESEEITAILGIDVSVYQGKIDWAKVRESGVEFAMIRVGYRGYSIGNIYEDANFTYNIENAIENGIKVGIYFFSQAVSVEEAIEEAEFVLSKIQDYKISFPVVFDWENISESVARTDNISAETLTDCAVAFCDTVTMAGYTPMIYFNKYISLVLYDLSRLADYDFWLAEYNETPNFYYDFKIWQYGNNGKVDGIAGNVDMNLSFIDYSNINEIKLLDE